MSNGKLRGRVVSTSSSAASGIFNLESQFLERLNNTWTSNVPVYSVTPSTTSIVEGNTISFTISTTNVPIGTTLYWTNSGTTAAADFGGSVNSGSINITSGTVILTLTLVSADSLEGTESIILELRTGSTSGTIVATAATVSVSDAAPTYSISPSTSSVNEGSTVTWSVTTTNVANSTTLYWTNSGTTTSSDFSGSTNSGSFTITNNSGSISRTLTSDVSTEGSETIIIQIRTGSTSGTIVATSSTVTVNDTSTAAVAPSTVDYLMIGGGAGGGRGGGGAGGYVYQTNIAVSNGTTYTITVGAGSAGQNPTGSTRASQGGNTTISVSGSIIDGAYGGGGGGAFVGASAGGNGGSGGGGSPYGGNQPGGKGVYPGSTYVSATRQGYDGGAGIENGLFPGGGGGGAGGAGGDGSGGAGGNGGIGLSNSISGSSLFYAGGGGGGMASNGGTTNGSGGSGIGGSNGSSGTTNRGGGGGGKQYGAGMAGSGGSGVFIVRYSSSFSNAFSTTGSPTLTTVGGYKIYTFTGNGTIRFG